MQTSIEWLIKEISRDRVGKAIIITFANEFQLAKKMNKQEIIDSYNQGYRDGEHDNFLVNNKKDISEYSNADNYYNQTYKQ